MIPPAVPSLPTISSVSDPGTAGKVAPSSAANFMPSTTSAGRQLSPMDSAHNMPGDYLRQRPMVINPRLAPSTVTTERALEARTLLAPQFQHNVMATRIARTSNLMADAPRFRSQLDVLA